jgi:hypothetical protein
LAAGALGQIGSIEALPDLHHAFRTDLEVDELGHTPSSQAKDAMTSVLRNWVSQQIQGTRSRTFRESTATGELTGTVTTESLPFDTQGRINLTLRYPRLLHSAVGPSCAFKMDLQTSFVDPFEIEVEYVDPSCVIRRTLIYQQILDSAKFNWAVHTILEPAAMKSPPPP